jgi:hypothetical protein
LPVSGAIKAASPVAGPGATSDALEDHPPRDRTMYDAFVEVVA